MGAGAVGAGVPPSYCRDSHRDSGGRGSGDGAVGAGQWGLGSHLPTVGTATGAVGAGAVGAGQWGLGTHLPTVGTATGAVGAGAVGAGQWGLGTHLPAVGTATGAVCARHQYLEEVGGAGVVSVPQRGQPRAVLRRGRGR